MINLKVCDKRLLSSCKDAFLKLFSTQLKFKWISKSPNFQIAVGC